MQPRAVVVMVIVLISMLLGKSPALLVSGLGAMTAVLMLVFAAIGWWLI